MRASSWRILPALLLGLLCGAAGRDALRPARAEAPEAADLERARLRMVDRQIADRGIRDARLLAALRRVPRHEFVPRDERAAAYEDRPLPIGHGQTISQPYIVALMTSLARVGPGDRVLEVGTGSGYQAALLAELGAEVYTIEIVEPLAHEAAERLARLGWERVRVRHGDGYRGWPGAAPFDAILVTAAAPRVPPDLIDQLAEGGRLVIPLGEDEQLLEVHTRRATGIEVERSSRVLFVPMTGEVRESR